MTNQPITEFAFLKVIPPNTTHTPNLKSSLLAASKAQSSWSGYPLHFFSHHSQEQENSSEAPEITVYLISGWNSVQDHYAWIASPTNQEWLTLFRETALMEVGGAVHLGIDFTQMVFDECRFVVWRKRLLVGAGDTGDTNLNGTQDWEDNLNPTLNNPAAVGRDNDVKEVERDQASSAGKSTEGKARVLWSYRGCTLEDGAKEEYELTAYSEGTPPVFSEEYTVMHKMELENEA